jgi:hypothetical protein
VRVETVVCRDTDVCWLWQPELDGIEAARDLVGGPWDTVNLHPRDWFIRF